jgi:hypothetical protein
MRQMFSAKNTTPNRARQVTQLKKQTEAVTSRLGSDAMGVLATADPDFRGFGSGPLGGMMPITTPSVGGGVTTVMGVMPDEQTSSWARPYYGPGTTFALDRVGNGSIDGHIVRPGAPPAGYMNGSNILVNRRVKEFTGVGDPSDPDNLYYRYNLVTGGKPKDYQPKVNEALDGSYYPGSNNFGIGRPVGNIFPNNGGSRTYNSNPYGDNAWDGALHSSPLNAATAPTITAISPDNMDEGTEGTVIV